MSQPSRQVEVQLGHLCNNRCVFCVSGQLSAQKRAPQLAEAPIRRQLRAARDNGATKITLLGGEPTLQRSFLPLLRFAVELDFDEIVIFTNGTMTPRSSFRARAQAILNDLGPRARERVVWRFSLQGGDELHHDATTVNPGAWQRIQTSMTALHADGARLTGNMCVVEQNYRSVATLAEVAERFDFEDLHLDMVRPRDSGDRTDDELRGMMARYSDMAPHFRALVSACAARLKPGFDLNIGNLPYCIAPDLAHVVHHDGEATVTVAASGQGTTQEGFDKYADKRSDKHKLPNCSDCVFDDRCGGVFDKYAEFHGHGEFLPVSHGQLARADATGAHFVLLAEPGLRRWAAARQQRGVAVEIGRVDEPAGSVDVAIPVASGGRWRLVLRDVRNPERRGGWFVASAAQGDVAQGDVAQGDVAQGDVAQGDVAQGYWGFAAEWVGAPPDGGEDVLTAALAEIATALACDAPSLDLSALHGAWRATRRRLTQTASRQRDGRRRVVALAERLKGRDLGGLAFASLSRGDASGALALRWQADDAWIQVEIAPGGAQAKPQFSHEMAGLTPQQLAAFNAALGAALRGGRPAAVVQGATTPSVRAASVAP